LAADLLQSIVNRAYQQGLFQLPIPNRDIEHFPIVQYADDTLLIMEADARQLFCLKALLHSFCQFHRTKGQFSQIMLDTY
jgi:hypothetical protein